MKGLYAIADVSAIEARDLDLIRFVEAVLRARPAAIQLRDKHGSSRATLDRLAAIAPLAHRAGVPFFANDRPDLALLAGCSGVHVGQEDIPPAMVRELLSKVGGGVRKSLLVGLSTHDEAQVEAALQEPVNVGRDSASAGLSIDYLAFGPVFPTRSKDNPDPVVGTKLLSAITARVKSVRPALPVVAIGGITIARAPELRGVCDVAAVIAGLLPEPGCVHDGDSNAPYREIEARARAFVEVLS